MAWPCPVISAALLDRDYRPEPGSQTRGHDHGLVVARLAGNLESGESRRGWVHGTTIPIEYVWGIRHELTTAAGKYSALSGGLVVMAVYFQRWWVKFRLSSGSGFTGTPVL